MLDAHELQLLRHVRTVSIPTDLTGPATPSHVDPAVCRAGGLAELASGHVAVLTLAGGRSTRMGGRSRWDLPIGAVTGRTLLQLQGERMAAVRERRAAGLIWLIMTSDATHQTLVQTLQRHSWFGFPAEDVWLLRQPSLPVLDDRREPVRSPDGSILRTPTGHGAMLEVLRAGGALHRLADRQVRSLFVFQYPNVLESIADPLIVGLHRLSGHDATVKVVPPGRPDEESGRVASIGRGTAVVEYHAIRQEAQQERFAAYPVFMGTSVWSLDFLLRHAELALPYHLVPHSEPGRDRPAWRLERFIFDLLPYSASTGVVPVSREDGFAMIKRLSGHETPEIARAALLHQHRSWLDLAGAAGPGHACRVEVSPSFALDVDELKSRLPTGYTYVHGTVLE